MTKRKTASIWQLCGEGDRNSRSPGSGLQQEGTMKFRLVALGGLAVLFAEPTLVCRRASKALGSVSVPQVTVEGAQLNGREKSNE